MRIADRVELVPVRARARIAASREQAMDWRPLAVLIHVLAAFWYVAGYVGTNLCTELARRAPTDEDCRSALQLSGRFDRWLNAPGGTAVGLTGLAAVVVFGYALTTPWVALAIVLFAGIVLLGIFYWGRFGRRVERAMTAGDWAGVRSLLTEPRIVLVSRLENVALLVVIILMVLRPG
jgi:uncharacterized membrane protein